MISNLKNLRIVSSYWTFLRNFQNYLLRNSSRHVAYHIKNIYVEILPKSLVVHHIEQNQLDPRFTQRLSELNRGSGGKTLGDSDQCYTNSIKNCYYELQKLYYTGKLLFYIRVENT